MTSDEDREIAARLQEVKARRGYLLPHHGLLAITSEAMLAAYDQAYKALALDPRILSVHDREAVWLAILIATDEALATHHIAKFRAGGGTDDEIQAILQVTAWAVGGSAYRFVADHWLPHLPGFDIDTAYCDGLAHVAGPVGLRIAILASCAVHACRGEFTLLKRALRFGYRENVPEAELAEALSLVMFPGSVPNFVEAARAWLELIRDGEVEPGPAFAAWARLEGQGGFDEASGVKR